MSARCDEDARAKHVCNARCVCALSVVVVLFGSICVSEFVFLLRVAFVTPQHNTTHGARMLAASSAATKMV